MYARWSAKRLWVLMRYFHAAAHEMGALEFQVLEQALALRHVVRPGDALDSTARLPSLAPVENDAGVFLRQVIEQLDAGVHALRGPLVQGRIEPGGRVHEQRRPVADHLVAGLDAVDERGGHVSRL